MKLGETVAFAGTVACKRKEGETPRRGRLINIFAMTYSTNSASVAAKAILRIKDSCDCRLKWLNIAFPEGWDIVDITELESSDASLVRIIGKTVLPIGGMVYTGKVSTLVYVEDYKGFLRECVKTAKPWLRKSYAFVFPMANIDDTVLYV